MTQIKRILFPTDFSKSSDAGLPFATSLARDNQAELLILHVEEPPASYAAGAMYYGVTEPDSAALAGMLDAVQPGDEKVRHVHRLVEGNPADKIVEVAEQEKADVIVMGTHGRTGIARLLLGSVAEAVIRTAHCPVLTFRMPEQTSE